ncbi:MAG: M61 family metallopeptidase [Pyrinomonadaceae bacterium]|nr:M61 family metallopeptidase [Pyrinomonadaceae bacterium]
MNYKELAVSTRRSLAIISALFCLSIVAAAIPRIEHTVTINDPQSTVLRVSTNISGLNAAQLELALPNWTPGYYTTEDYARNIARLTFTDAATGRTLHHTKSHDHIWTLDTRGAAAIKIDFEYAANQLDLTKSRIYPSYAILNGTNFFFYIKDHTLDMPASVNFKLPEGWRIATGLTPTANPAQFTAENYDVLVDCPTLVGKFDSVTLDLRGVPHHLAVAPKGVIAEGNLRKLADNYLKVIDAHTRMFREIPYKQYWTINLFEERDIGGLEHLNSYLGILSPESADPAGFDNLTGLTSHEFFHAYNVKRIRPAEMWPYRYEERNFTPLLWVSEGVTDYYTTRGMLRAGLMNRDAYLQYQGGVMGAVQAVEAARYISVEEASTNTWFGGIGGQNQPFSVDYYSRGHVLGLLLDLSIRHDTNNRQTFDDVLRYLYTNHYKNNRGFTTADLVGQINRMTGKDYRPFFEKYVSGTAPLPFAEVLAFAGLRFEERKTKLPRLGISQGAGDLITDVVRGSAAEAAGAKAGDRLLGVGNFSTDNPNWAAEFRQFYADKEGATVKMYLLRDDKPVILDVKVRLVENSAFALSQIPEIAPAQKALLDKWLAGE